MGNEAGQMDPAGLPPPYLLQAIKLKTGGGNGLKMEIVLEYYCVTKGAITFQIPVDTFLGTRRWLP